MKNDLRTIGTIHKLGPFDIGADIDWLPIPPVKGSMIIDESKYLGDPHEHYHGEANDLKLAHGFGRWQYRNNLVYEG